MRVLDACAAPGGKAFLLADAVGPKGRVDAVDADAGRLDDLASSRARLGFKQVHVTQRHWIREAFGSRDDDAPYDAVLLDAPCSGLGVIRRHPDVRWARVERDLPGFAARQLKLLEAVAPAVRPGGVLVYAVCTFTAEETHSVVEAFSAGEVARSLGFGAAAPVPELGLGPDLFDGPALRTYPHRHDADAFFAVRLEREA
jgi:16S rRNA (cytosine967-C5)-methyltransferase